MTGTRQLVADLRKKKSKIVQSATEIIGNHTHNEQMLFENTPASRRSVQYGFRVSAERPMAMLARCPAYSETPMLDMEPPASSNAGRLWVKNEAQRMRLGSFKALGGAFAVAQIIADRANEADFETDAYRRVASELTFITASAGNHGLSVAAGARIFGARSVIILAATVPGAFAERIRRAGGEVVRVDGDYDASVDYAKKAADENGWLLLADGSWEGYIDPPALVMEGYTVIAEECRRFFAQGNEWPTHIFLQAGVGGLAASFSACVRSNWPEQPRIVVVEPEAAPCVLESVKNGRLTRVEGPVSNMGRLDCKEASLIAFDALRGDADYFATISDRQADDAAQWLIQRGMKTTPSGASGLAALCEFPLPADSRCLILVTEGSEET